MLGFDKYWDYPKSNHPMLWGINRKYYYKGNCVAEVHGGDMFQNPDIEITESGTNLKIIPINMALLLKRNRDALFLLENEAIDFIESTFKKNRERMDKIAVAYSGGKDSQVTLHLVSRVLPPDEFLVNFTDTDMEIPFTYDNVNETEIEYKKKYPGLLFYRAQPHEKSIIMWKKFGPPSRLIRWCCSVYKTVPFARLMKTLQDGNNQPQMLVFEGVRADESSKRSRYERNANKVKHINIANCRPILYWNTTEVFLYLFSRDISINRGYRYGLTRVGCSICPFASSWSEFIISKLFPDLTKGYTDILEEYAKAMGIKDKNVIKEYIREGQWKSRAGGIGIDTQETGINMIQTSHKLKAVLSNPRENWFEWIKTLGDVIRYNKDGKIIGEIRIEEIVFPFTVEEKQNKAVITVEHITDKPLIMSKVKNSLYKTTYCINCGTCEVECPTGALTTIPKVNVDVSKCINCYNCLTFVKSGCLMAKSAKNGVRNVSMNTRGGIDRYSTFGFREKWVDSYLKKLENWWESEDMTLGVKQVPAFTHWLIDCEMIEASGRKSTVFSNKIRGLYHPNNKLFWELIWVNLSYNSQIVSWYANNTRWGIKYTKEELRQMISEDFQGLSEGTLNNALGALVNTFDENPLGSELKLGLLETKGRAVKGITKIGPGDKIHPLTIAYSLYRYIQDKNRKTLTVSELYDDACIGGPYKLFGISKTVLENTLRWLQENKNELVRVELVAGLDNITLREDITPIQVIDYIGRL